MEHRKWDDMTSMVGTGWITEHNALYDAWRASERRVMETLDENNRLDRELDEAKKQLKVEHDRADDLLKDRNYYSGKLTAARKRIAELEAPTRVPFTDAQIGRMAESLWGQTRGDWSHRAIRAALAAGGLEPCADPTDVALRPADDACKTPLEMKQIFGKARAYTLENTAVIQYEDTYIYLSPADAARMAAWLSSYAAAHGVVTYRRNPANSYFEGDPKPANEEVEKLARVLRETHAKTCGKVPDAYELDGFRNDARAAIAHLCPTTGHVLRDRLVDAERKIHNQRAELKRLNALVAELRDEVNEDNTNAAGGLEPCDDPADVAWTPLELWRTPLEFRDPDDERVELYMADKYGALLSVVDKDAFITPANAVRMAAWLSSYASAHGAPDSDLRAMLTDAERKIHNQRMSLRELHEARERDAAKLAAVTAERDSFSAECTWLKEQITNGKSQLAALRERDSVPVKVRWDVSDDHIKMAVELGTFIRLDLDKVAHLREVFAAHAVIDVPAGVPSVEELVEIALGTSEPHGVSHRQVAAIRDAVLAGLAQPSSNAVQFDEVEALARVLREAYAKHDGDAPEVYPILGFRIEARAAIAHMRQRPKGLPTADLLKTIAIAFYQYSGVAEMVLDKHDEARFGRILAALAPYLREPVGKPELDVKDSEIQRIVNSAAANDQTCCVRLKDYFRSSIRPTYECKECAKLRSAIDSHLDEKRSLFNRINAARAALEGAGFAEHVAEQARKTEDLEQRVAVITQSKQHLDAARAALEGE